jgi:hypothetical protein
MQFPNLANDEWPSKPNNIQPGSTRAFRVALTAEL